MKNNFLYHFVKRNHISKPLFITYFAALFLILYFGFFIIFGDKGLFKLSHLKDQITEKEITKKAISAKMKNKKHLVDSMSSESLDVDLLDEQARKTLGYAGKNEVILYKKSKNK